MISLLLLLAVQDWPQFRGPAGRNVTDDKTLPLAWGPAENLLWTSPLPAVGHASPVVVGGRVIVCGVKWEGGKPDPAVIPEHHVTAYAADDGKKLWDAVLPPGPWRRDDFRSGPGGGYAAPTPCSDGRRVFVAFSSSVIAAYELDGTLAWRKEIKPHTFDVTLGSSPVIFGETVILLCARKMGDSRLLALRKSDGEPAWETSLPKTGFAHSTPLLIDVKGKPQMLVVASGTSKTPEALQSFDPADGRRIWWCKGAGDASSPAYADGLVYFDSGRGSDGTAVEPGEGEVAPKWTAGPLGECISSPIIVNGHVFRLQGSGVVKVWKLSDGTEAGKKRLEKLGSTWATPLLDGNGRLYFASGGKSVVVKADPSLEELGAGDLGDANHASPAVSKGRLYLLGQKNLYCVGAR